MTGDVDPWELLDHLPGYLPSVFQLPADSEVAELHALTARHALEQNAGWARLLWHPEQQRLWRDASPLMRHADGSLVVDEASGLFVRRAPGTLDHPRYSVTMCGRGSGKSTLYIRLGLEFALFHDLGRYGLVLWSAPTWPQVKRIYWEQLCRVVPKALVRKKNESEYTLRLAPNDVTLGLMGLDKPERLEGPPFLDWLCIDENADCHERIFDDHVAGAIDRPDRLGYAHMVGTPNGQNHHFLRWHAARAGELGPLWRGYKWTTEEINPRAAAERRATLDARTYEQEYLANPAPDGGRAYYAYDARRNRGEVPYDPLCEWLLFAFDFNVDPMCVVCAQEGPGLHWMRDSNRGETVLRCVAEVFQRNSNTRAACLELIRLFNPVDGVVARHPKDKPLRIHGDPSGGARKSSALQNDWDIINQYLRKVWRAVEDHHEHTAPSERARLNSVNSLLHTYDGRVRLVIDRERCKELHRDFMQVQQKPDGSIDKDATRYKLRTHLTDAVGYPVYSWYPVDVEADELQMTSI